MLKNHDRIAGLVIFAVCVLFYHNTLEYPGETAQFPRGMLIIMLALSGWMILRSFIFADWRKMEYEDFFIHGGRFTLAVATMAGYIFAINTIGYYSTSIIYIPVMALLLGFRNKIMIIASTVFYLFIILVVFDIFFERQLPKEFFM